MRRTFEVELREAGDGNTLAGTVLTEGRAASGGRAEVFAPNSLSWAADGIGIRAAHGQPVEARAWPQRATDGRITIATRATTALRSAVEAGRRFMSVEFVATESRTTKAGVREILSAFLRDAALTDDPEYDTTAAELRQRAGGRRLWL